MSDIYSNFAFCRVTTPCTSTVTSIPVDDVTSLPSNSQVMANDFYMTLDAPLTHPSTYEIIKITGVSGTNLTVLRAQEGTTGQPIATGTLMRGSLTAGMLARMTGQALSAWITIGTFTNSWVAFGGATAPPSYYLGPDGVVHLRGQIKSGTGGLPAFTLPAGFRPEYAYDFPTITAASGGGGEVAGYIDVATNGAVTANIASGGGSGYVLLDGISFRQFG